MTAIANKPTTFATGSIKMLTSSHPVATARVITSLAHGMHEGSTSRSTRKMTNVMREVQAYADAKLRKEPPVQCDLKVGDRVTYTNEYGVSFPRMLVIGFAHDDSFYGRFVHLAGPDHPGAYWFPHRRDELAKENSNDGHGATALMGAAGDGHIDTVRTLIEAGADVGTVGGYVELQLRD